MKIMFSPQEIHDTKRLIAFYEAIPDEQWCQFYTTDKEGRHCAVGHLGEKTGRQEHWRNPDSFILDALVRKQSGYSAPTVNDDACCGFRGATAKDRILNVLRGIVTDESVQSVAENSNQSLLTSSPTKSK